MKIKNLFSVPAFCFLALSCSSSDDITEPSSDPNSTVSTTEAMYFPPSNSDVWETKSLSALNWHQDKVQDLLTYLETKHSKSFMILQNGRIVMENYFRDILLLHLGIGQAQEKR
jgi:hypothetical protein